MRRLGEVFAAVRRVGRDFWNWFLISARKPENFPAYLSAVFTVALAIFAYLAWRESQAATAIFAGQLEAAQKQLQEMRDEQRPWVYAEVSPYEPAANLMPTINAWLFSIKLTYHNVGHETAVHVWPSATAIVTKMDTKIHDDQEQACNNTDDWTGNTSLRGDVVFPGQTLESSTYVRIPVREWQDASKASHGLVIAGCVRYSAGKTTHKSKFAYIIAHKDGKGVQPLPVDIATTDARSLFISPWLEDGAFDAD